MCDYLYVLKLYKKGVGIMNILITGASSGIGKAVKDYFIDNGHSVFALDVNEIKKEERLFSFVADIKDINSLNKVKEYLDSNNIGLDVIINVAGIHKMASLVESDFNEMKKVIDVNLIGTMLVNKVFYPLLTKEGRIVIVTSEVAPFDPLPFNGLYNVSKTALDSYAQALRQELNLNNQKVITIRPGAVETPLSNNSMEDTKSLANTTELYKRQASKFLKIATTFMGTPIKPIKVAKLIYKVTNKKNPKFIYSIHTNIGLLLLNLLPKKLQCWIIKLLLK